MAAPGTDPVSQLAHDIINAGTYDHLVVDGGTPAKARDLLANVSPDELLAVPVKSLGHAYSMLAGLWLWHDALHECHEIAQADVDALHRTALNLHRKRSKTSENAGSVQSREIDRASFDREKATATNSLNFWHAIMHRREGDFWNSKYWYARCRSHLALVDIALRAKPLLATLGDAALAGSLSRGGWDPDAFVDWVETLHRSPDLSAEDLAAKLQQIEWQALFDACAREAAGG